MASQVSEANQDCAENRVPQARRDNKVHTAREASQAPQDRRDHKDHKVHRASKACEANRD